MQKNTERGFRILKASPNLCIIYFSKRDYITFFLLCQELFFKGRHFYRPIVF